MLLQLADECKQLVWAYLGVQELCRMACVARDSQQGVRFGPIWLHHARALVTSEQEALKRETGALGCRLQRGLASRNLLDHKPAQALDALDVDWRIWYRDTHVALVTFRTSNAAFSAAMDTLQELKTERAQLKEAQQSLKAQSHADRRNRRVQLNCVRWMNRTHRRHAAAANSIQAQTAALSKAEVVERLQRVESAIQDKTREIFGVRSRALKSLHRVNTQIASGARLLRDLGADERVHV